MKKHLETLRKRCVAAISNPNLDVEVADELRERYLDAQRRMHRLDDEDGFRRYLRAYVQEEYRKHSENHETSGDRLEPLCECKGAPCELQKGDIPDALKDWGSMYGPSPNPDRLVLQYSEQHPEELVLTEARNSWHNRFADIEEEYLEIIFEAKQSSRPELV